MACAKPRPTAWIASDALVSTPSVALAKDSTRLACRSPSYKVSMKLRTKLGRPKGSLGVPRLDGKEDEIRCYSSRLEDHYRQAHRRCRVRLLQLHEHPRARAEPLACICGLPFTQGLPILDVNHSRKSNGTKAPTNQLLFVLSAKGEPGKII